MDRRLDLAGAVAVVVVGLVIIYLGVRLESVDTIRDPLSADGMPLGLGVFITVIGLVLAWRQGRLYFSGAGRYAPSEGKSDNPDHPSSFTRVLLIWVTAMLYGWGMTYVGYMPAAFLTVLVIMWLMGVRNATQMVIVALIYAAVTWALFAVALDVNLPSKLIDV